MLTCYTISLLYLCGGAAAEGQGGVVLASTFVRKTEDQLDAYREGIILILDQNQDMLGWSAKAKGALLLFKEDLVQQIGLGLDLPCQRFRIVSVSKANHSKSWKALDRDPTFYLGLPAPLLLLPRRHKRTRFISCSTHLSLHSTHLSLHSKRQSPYGFCFGT